MITPRSEPPTAPTPAGPGHDEDHTQLFAEKGRIERLDRIPELVFGDSWSRWRW